MKAEIFRAPPTGDAGTPTSDSGRKKPAPLDPDRFGIVSDADWLLIAPSHYVDYSQVTRDFTHFVTGSATVIEGIVTQKTMYDSRGNETADKNHAERLLALVRNQAGQQVEVWAFGRPGYVWAKHSVGDKIRLRAVPKVTNSRNPRMVLSNPEFVGDDVFMRIMPVFPTIKRTKGERFLEKVREHYDLIGSAGEIVEQATGWRDPGAHFSIEAQFGYPSGKAFLRSLLFPKTIKEGEDAQKIARYLAALALVRRVEVRNSARTPSARASIDIRWEDIEELKTRVPFPLSHDQDAAISGICASLRSDVPMRGLLSGDVGSGKTLAFLLPAIAAHRAGAKVMVLTPNLLLIEQVQREATALFPEIQIATVTSEGISGNPEHGIVIGSTALLHAMKKGKLGSLPDFLIVDEQHKFSVAQREEMIAPGTNLLEATATPIPRTKALITYGDQDVFLLSSLPVKKDIVTALVGRERAKDAIIELVEAVVKYDEKAAVIYPLVQHGKGDSPGEAKKALSTALQSWQKHIDQNLIVTLHGRMSEDEKRAALEAFSSGAKPFLLSTIVIVVGVTVKNFRNMLVVDADRMGVVTLHQLRGRLAREGGDGLFLMMADNPSEDSVQRLQLLVDHDDGFTLAEKDAEVRGYGDFVSAENDVQSGKTRSLFLGVDIGPREIGHIANLRRLASEGRIVPSPGRKFANR